MLVNPCHSFCVAVHMGMKSQNCRGRRRKAELPALSRQRKGERVEFGSGRISAERMIVSLLAAGRHLRSHPSVKSFLCSFGSRSSVGAC